jgi:hypothetical protein
MRNARGNHTRPGATQFDTFGIGRFCFKMFAINVLPLRGKYQNCPVVHNSPNTCIGLLALLLKASKVYRNNKAKLDDPERVEPVIGVALLNSIANGNFLFLAYGFRLQI